MSKTLTFIRDFPLHCSRKNTVKYTEVFNNCSDHQLHKNCSMLFNLLLPLTFSIIPTEPINIVGKSYRTNCLMLSHNCFPSHKHSWIHWHHNSILVHLYLAIKLYKNYFAFKDFQMNADTHHDPAHTCNAL